MDYAQHYAESLNDPQNFWLEQAEQIDWFHKPSVGLTDTPYSTQSWFADAQLNTCYLALDKHVNNGRGEQVAFYYDSAATGIKSQINYHQLLEQVSLFAGALAREGIEKGDRVIIYMPMIPEATVAMLACARIGAVHSVVFGGFAANELAVRIDDAQAKMVITASCGIEFDRTIPYKPLVDQAVAKANHKVQRTVVYQRACLTAELTQSWDVDWSTFIEGATPAPCVTVQGDDPLYILYTSGTTGAPKGIVRDNAGHAVAMTFAFNTIYGMQAGDVWWAASDIGWVVGHSFIVYAPLMCGASSVLYEGKPVRTPDAGTFWRIIDEYKVNGMITAPTAFRAIRKDDSHARLAEKYDLSSLRWLFVAGEKLDSATFQWLSDLLGIPVLDHWWQTETGAPMTAPLMGWNYPSPTRLGSTNKCVPGYDIRVVNDEGEELAAGEIGNICVKLPMPPGTSWQIWNQPERYAQAYLEAFPGYYHTGDGGYKDETDYVFITGRTDDVINVSGHRLSTGEMEEALSSHPAVAECAVIGVPDALKGQLPIGLVVLKGDSDITCEQLTQELIANVRSQIGALACYRQTLIVQRLPKTRSGKILRAVLRKVAANEPYKIPSTIDDPAILDEISQCLARR